MEIFLATLFEDVRNERLLIIILYSMAPDILQPAGFTEYEISFSKNLALEKLHRQKP